MSRTRASGLPVSDEIAIRALHRDLIAAANRGDAEAFAAVFTDTADFVEFEGTHLVGADQIAAFHRPFFETTLRGWRFGGDVRFVHPSGSDVAVLLAEATTTMPGHDAPTASRDALQLVVVTWGAGEWRIQAMQNARRLTLERQELLDALETPDRGIQRYRAG